MKNPSVSSKTASPPFMVNKNKLLRSIVDVICVFSEEGILHYASPSAKQLFGYRPQEIEGHSFLSFIHPNDVEKTVQVLNAGSPHCRLSHFENRIIHKNGSVVPVMWSGRRDEDDRLLYCVAREGREKQEIEQRLLKAQQLAGIASYEFDVINHRYTHVSDTFFKIFGLDRKRHPVFTTEIFWSLVHPDDLEKLRRNLLLPEQLYSEKMEYRIIRPDGETVYISRYREVIRDAEGNPVKTIGTLQDITGCKKSEFALRQSEERFRSLVQNGNDLLGIIDADGNYIFVGDNVKGLLGYQANEMVGRNALEFIHPEDVQRLGAILQEVTDTITVGPFRFRNKMGEWRWIETTVSNHLGNHAIGGLVVNSRDITEKKLKEDALALTRQRFEALMKNGSDLIVIIDEAANVLYCSSNVGAVLGYTPEELHGRNAFEFIHPGDRQKVSVEIAAVLACNKKGKGVQHRFLHKNGCYVWLESKGTDHRRNGAIGGILVNSRNIDDRVKLQRRLSREQTNKQREITAAVIRAQEAERSQLGLELHDNVNQILTTVKLYNEIYLTGYVPDKELLVKATQYTQDCINEIRSISRRLSAPTLGKISLQDSVKELVDSINLTRRLEIIYLPEGIGGRSFPEDLHLTVYRIIQEGLNNIIKYSRAAVACVEIRFREGQLCLTISDNGRGFDTTAKRDGIGLTNIKTRAEHLNGTFSVSSAPGKGCELKIVFPCEVLLQERNCEVSRI